MDEGGGVDPVAGGQFSSPRIAEVSQGELLDGGVNQGESVVDRQRPLLAGILH